MRRLGSFTLLLVMLVAGCASPDEEPAADDGIPAPPDPRIAQMAARNETTAIEEGAGGEEHAHDGWGAEGRLTLVDQDIRGVARSDGKVEARFRPFGDTLVLEGTATLEVVLTEPRLSYCSRVAFVGIPHCTPAAPDPSPTRTLHLWFRHASTTEWIDAGVLAWDTPLLLPVENATWVDMPHSGLSLWEFDLRSDQTRDEGLVARIRIDIVRGAGEIPRWPGHPRFYDDGNLREVLVATARTQDDPVSALQQQAQDASAIHAERLISWGTRTLVIDVNITDVASPPGLSAGRWYLAYANATGDWRFTDFGDPAHPGNATYHRWVLEVDDDGMDSPYSDKSRWKFALLGSFRADLAGVDELVMTFLAAYTVDYEIRVVASDLDPSAFGGASRLDPFEG